MSWHHILSVDDSKMVQMVVEEALAPYHVEVASADNGKEALAYAKDHPVDLILLDITMPVMDGVETLSHLQADPRTAPIPVIMLTAESDRKTVISVAQLGVRDYICKPFDEKMLIDRVLKVVPLVLRSTLGAQAAPPSAALPVPHRTAPSSSTISVAVVDDKLATVERVQSILADTTWTITAQTSPTLAFQEIKAQRPQCLLLSLGLGTEFTTAFYRQIRSDATLRDLPVIGLSVRVKTDEQRAAREIGIRSIVTKPIDPLDLKLTMMREMGLKLTQVFMKEDHGHGVLRLPDGLSDFNVQEISRQMQMELIDLFESGSRLQSVLLDLRDYTLASLAIAHLLLDLSKLCATSRVPFRAVATPLLIDQAHSVVELGNFSFHQNLEEARASLKN